MKAPRLQPGDLVSIISPSNTIAYKQKLVEKARANFETNTGLRTVLAPNALAEHYYSAGTPGKRIDDFHWALTNPDVKAIIFSIGGSTAVDLVDKLDYDLITSNPKIIAGISDASTLLNAIHTKTGLITFHGIEFLDFGRHEMAYTYESIKQAWFSDEPIIYHSNANWKDLDDTYTTYNGWETIREGVATGTLRGGNFRCFTQLRGTQYFNDDFSDAILVIEAYKWPKRHLHQALVDARLWGVLNNVRGLIVGYCLESDDPKQQGNNQSMKDLVLEATEGYDFPVMWVGEVGHNIENLVLPIGAQAHMDAINLTFEIAEKVTS